jgi:hemoglobin
MQAITSRITALHAAGALLFAFAVAPGASQAQVTTATAVPTASALPTEPTLYQELGGAPAFSAVLTDAIELWFKNPLLAESFKNTDKARLHLLLLQQITLATGGGGAYTGRDMASAHKGLNVTTAQFNALAEDLQQVLEKYDVPYRLQNRLIALLAPVKRDIVSN